MIFDILAVEANQEPKITRAMGTLMKPSGAMEQCYCEGEQCYFEAMNYPHMYPFMC